MIFRPFSHWRRARRASKARERAALRETILPMTADRTGPPAVALARQRYADHRDIVIDPLETEARAHPAGTEVRAWVLVPHADLPAPLADTLASSTAKLDPLTQTERQIFFLRTAYGIGYQDIAILLGVPERAVRAAVLRAIAALDADARASPSTRR